MFYKEAKVNTFNPPLSEEVKQRFIHELANLCCAAVRFNGGAVVEEDDNQPQVENFYAMAYLMGWKWRQNLIMDVARETGWPEPEFVDFVHDMVIRLGLIPYNPNEQKNRQEFLLAMENEPGRDIEPFPLAGYPAWCKALNREHTPHVAKQLGKAPVGAGKED
ncbi:hypothetical protein [Burkholderia phage FLC6]|nr:hypothetical protein [Burkholderia phage FLC6]